MSTHHHNQVVPAFLAFCRRHNLELENSTIGFSNQYGGGSVNVTLYFKKLTARGRRAWKAACDFKAKEFEWKGTELLAELSIDPAGRQFGCTEKDDEMISVEISVSDAYTCESKTTRVCAPVIFDDEPETGATFSEF